MTMKSLKLDFKPLIKKLDFFSKKVIDSEYSGEYRSLNKHKGIEFEDYKKYIPGDDATLIDWKASLRSKKLLIRRYTQVKNLNMIILVDVSDSMLFSSINKLKCEYAAELAASLSFYFLKSQDNVGIGLFNNKMVKYLPPNVGSKQLFLITKILSNPDFYGGNFNLSNALGYASNFIKHGAVLIIISDFIGLEKKWEKSIQVLSKHADIIGIIIRDPGDISLKDKIGHAVISNPLSGRIISVDLDKIRADYEHNSKQILEEIKHTLKKNRVESIKLETDKSFIDPVIKFFSERRTRWL